MKHRLLRAFTALPVAGLLVTFQPAAPTITAHALNYSQLNTIQKRILSGFASVEATGADSTSATPNNYIPRGSDACPVNLSSNIKVNQNCLNISDHDLQGRAQAQNETSVAINPMDTNDLIASYNDYRRGDGNCYTAYSTDNGRTWNDSTVPMGFTRGTANFGHAREYWQAGGDTSVAWDSRGNAYLDCQVFNRGDAVSPNQDQSSAVYVFRSTQNHGASFNFPGRPAFEFNDVPGNGLVLEDKPYMTVDNHISSTFRDRIYVTWTEFAADGSAYIWEVFSSDYGEHFSPRHLVSINAPTLCVNTFGFGTPQGSCNENQFSQPFTAPDGTLYVVFDNYNNALKAAQDNRNQILVSKSTDGGITFTGPIKVSDYFDLPDCATYQGGQDPGRACVPEKGASQRSVFRATNYPSGAVNPTNPAQVVVTFGSYINQHDAATCHSAGLAANGNNLFDNVKTPGCNNTIVESVSNDAGATFTGTTTDVMLEPVVTQASGQATTDQWWQWEAFNKSGKLAVSYYDRQYGDDETTGFSDISLSGSGDLSNFGVQRVTSSSMPTPTQFPDARGNSTFFGDYNAVDAATDAHPVWMDTRDPDLFLCPGTATTTTPPAVCGGLEAQGQVANDQDIFTANVSVPSK